jgi:hypothetical protein
VKLWNYYYLYFNSRFLQLERLDWNNVVANPTGKNFNLRKATRKFSKDALLSLPQRHSNPVLTEPDGIAFCKTKGV